MHIWCDSVPSVVWSSQSLSRRPTGGATKTTLAPCTEGQKRSSVWSCLMWLHYSKHNIRACTFGAALCQVLCGRSQSLSRRPAGRATKTTLAPCMEGQKRSSVRSCLMWLHLLRCQSHWYNKTIFYKLILAIIWWCPIKSTLN
jgi:hypothetical protein